MRVAAVESAEKTGAVESTRAQLASRRRRAVAAPPRALHGSCTLAAAGGSPAPAVIIEPYQWRPIRRRRRAAPSPAPSNFFSPWPSSPCAARRAAVLGVGAFAAAAVEQGVLHGEDIPIVFDIGFQMLTWMSLAWSLHDLLGPRAIALLGLAFAFVGNLMIAAAARSPHSSPYVYALAYGLIGGGGNGCFIGSFQFASLFESQGTRCAVLSSGFNVAGYVYLLLNVPGVSISGFYAGSAAFVAALAAAVAVTYPDRAYKPGDTPMLRWPTLGRRARHDDGAGRRRRARRRRRGRARRERGSATARAASPRRTRRCGCALRRCGSLGSGATARPSWAALVAQWASARWAPASSSPAPASSTSSGG